MRPSIEEFAEKLLHLREDINKRRLRHLLMTSSELFIVFILIGRGTELIYLHKPEEPLLMALHEIGHIPIRFHGFALLCACFAHILAINSGKWRLRAAMLFGEALFFVFSWIVLVLVGKPFLGMIVLPVIITFCFGNLFNVVYWKRSK